MTDLSLWQKNGVKLQTTTLFCDRISKSQIQVRIPFWNFANVCSTILKNEHRPLGHFSLQLIKTLFKNAMRLLIFNKCCFDVDHTASSTCDDLDRNDTFANNTRHSILRSIAHIKQLISRQRLSSFTHKRHRIINSTSSADIIPS